jgi:hypothetical protein
MVGDSLMTTTPDPTRQSTQSALGGHSVVFGLQACQLAPPHMWARNRGPPVQPNPLADLAASC